MLYSMTASIWDGENTPTKFDTRATDQDRIFTDLVSIIHLTQRKKATAVLTVFVSTNIGAPDDVIASVHIFDGEVDRFSLERVHCPFDDMPYACTHGCTDV